MGSGEFFLASLVGLFFGTIVLALYLYVMHRLGHRLADRIPVSWPLWQGIGLIGLAAWPVSLWPFLTGWDGFLKAGIALAFYILNAFPIAVGFGIGRDLRQLESRRRWRKNVDDWLGKWESEPAPTISEEDQES